MRYRWPADTVFTQQVLSVEQEECSVCQRALTICDHRFHRIFTLQGPLEIVCKLAHCPDPRCAAHSHTLSPLAESQITLPWWLLGWDVFCWLGLRRFARHWSVPQLQAELRDSFHIPLSDDAISASLRRYQIMVAARHQDSAVLAAAYAQRDALILTIDGLQPEKGHETLYVVRELGAKRIWFAQALLSSAAEEVQGLVAKAKSWAEQLGKPVQLWMSDKQDAFVKAIALEFPQVPHRYCQNHFLRDVAKPVLEADSHAKVKMRKKIRGLRGKQPPKPFCLAVSPVISTAGELPERLRRLLTLRAIEQDVLAQRRDAAAAATAAASPAAELGEAQAEGGPGPAVPDEAGDVVLDYCASVRGILNDGQGGPLHPPGLRMAGALGEVRESLQRNLDAKKGGVPRGS
jgi:hypothetical protein